MAARNYMRDFSGDDPESERLHTEERSIRDFRPSRERMRLQTPRVSETNLNYEQEPPRRGAWGMWIAAISALIMLCAAGVLILFPSTTITLVPHTHVVTFDASNPLTAYPAASAATGTIPYTVTTQVFEDSTAVAASGTEKAEEKATGIITIYNETVREMRLIKNTRFQSEGGLIFRIPASVNVAAMKGRAPGTAQATVFADQTGPKYNLGPQAKFTLPGLKQTPEYTKVYAKSSAGFAGGFSGTRPAVSAAVLDSTKAEVRGRLNEKAQELSKTAPEGSLAFPGLMLISYETLPATNEPGGGVRIHERASVAMPVFDARRFAQSLAQAVSASAEGQSVSIRFSDDTSAKIVGDLAAADIGERAITFTLAGRGQLIWNIDSHALAVALAGRPESVFETIVKGFPAIEEARARITPFWRHAFPADGAKIKVTVEEPAAF